MQALRGMACRDGIVVPSLGKVRKNRLKMPMNRRDA